MTVVPCAAAVAACAERTSLPPVLVFTGDFWLEHADDWTAQQRCNYIYPMDQTSCSWGRLTITTGPLAISVRGFNIFQGVSTSGQPIYRDSGFDTVALRVLDGCTVAIDSLLHGPNGLGVLKGDTLRFNGRGTSGDSLSWVYSAVQVQRPVPCP